MFVAKHGGRIACDGISDANIAFLLARIGGGMVIEAIVSLAKLTLAAMSGGFVEPAKGTAPTSQSCALSIEAQLGKGRN